MLGLKSGGHAAKLRQAATNFVAGSCRGAGFGWRPLSQKEHLHHEAVYVPAQCCPYALAPMSEKPSAFQRLKIVRR
jgi:hypothetical protein